MTTAVSLCRASLWMSSSPVPYSSAYSTRMWAAGSLPGLRTGTSGRPRLLASGAANRKPRDSIPTTAARPLSSNRSVSFSMVWRNACAFCNSGVMSRNSTPGSGKSGTSRMKRFRSMARRVEYSSASWGQEAAAGDKLYNRHRALKCAGLLAPIVPPFLVPRPLLSIEWSGLIWKGRCVHG